MIRNVLRLFAAFALVAGLALAGEPAAARGPGNYKVTGKEAAGGSYTGSAALTQTGENTWRIVWKIGNQTWNGFGIGDGEVIALNFTGNGQSGVMLLVTNEEKNGYKAFWAYTGAKEVGLEEWRR